MERLSPGSSIEDISNQVAEIEQLVGIGDEPLADNELVQELLDTLEFLVEYWASETKTWMRRRHEQLAFSKGYEIYRRLARAIILDSGLRKHDETGDADDVKCDIRDTSLALKTHLYANVYQKRLGTSKIERSKEKLAHRNSIRYMAGLAIRGVAGGAATLAAARYIQENSTRVSEIESSFARDGIAGALGILAVVSVKTLADHLKRSGPRQLGGVLDDRLNAGLKDYGRMKQSDRDRKSVQDTKEGLHEEYATRDLKEVKYAVSSKLFDFKIKSRSDVEPVVDAVLAIFEESIFEDFGICLEEPTWRQWLGADSSFNVSEQYEYID